MTLFDRLEERGFEYREFSMDFGTRTVDGMTFSGKGEGFINVTREDGSYYVVNVCDRRGLLWSAEFSQAPEDVILATVDHALSVVAQLCAV